VTLLFTDIEGSTQLLRDLGEAYAGTLAGHRRLLREAFERNNGVEVDTQGDAFFIAFAEAGDAVTAATEAERALSAGPVRVRMGIHTGEPVSTDEGYVGMDVHRAARICAAGHGGQVLLSRATRDLVSDECLDLGEHRLKGLTDTEWIFQLVIPELPGDFPPLQTVANSNLPSPSAPLIGREAEVNAASDLLGGAEARLVTLTGAGGSGKTRLALAIAAELQDAFPNGVFLVELAEVANPALVVPAIAETLGVREHRGRPLAEAVADFLSSRRMLLVLDNFEHVVDAGPEVGALLRAAPGLEVLTTSRMALGIEGEHELAVWPLSVEHAVALFRERARSIRPDVRSTDGTARTFRRSAIASTGFLLRSSWPPPLSGCCLSPRWSSDSNDVCPFLRAGAAIFRTGIGRCARRSSGVTTCSRTSSRRSSPDSGSSPEIGHSTRPRESATPTSGRSSRSPSGA
jgi:hypothetical protein